MKTFIRRFFILCKRLLRRPGFIVILLLVPILVAAMGIAASQGDGGVVTVALAMQDNEDPLANKIVDTLLSEGGLVRFVRLESPMEASASVEDGSADAAWIFSADLEKKIDKFVGHTHKNNAFVAVVQREDSVLLRLTHEKLNSAIYPYLSVALYSNFVLDNVVNTRELSEDELERFYYSVNAEGDDLFEFVYGRENNKEGADKAQETSFLIPPLRGLLAIMVALGGVAAAMFYMQDESRGAFDRLPRGAEFSFAAVYHTAAVAMVAVFALAAIFIAGISAGFFYELLAIIVYSAAVVGFCMCLRLLLRDLRLFGSVASILIIAMAVLCPIFFSAPRLPLIQYLLPAYYYIRAISNASFLCYMAAYALLTNLVAFGLGFLRVKKRCG